MLPASRRHASGMGDHLSGQALTPLVGYRKGHSMRRDGTGGDMTSRRTRDCTGRTLALRRRGGMSIQLPGGRPLLQFATSPAHRP